MAFVLNYRKTFFPKWQLEAVRMAIYLAFPVGLFYYFNQPENFEDYVIKMKRSMYPPENPAEREELERLQRRLSADVDTEFQNALDEYERKERQKAFI